MVRIREKIEDVFNPRYKYRPKRDILLASYPRSGNTWLRAVLAFLEVGVDPGSLRDLDGLVPDIHALPRVNDMLRQKRYIIKTHFSAHHHPVASRVLYIARDPRDAIPSYVRYVRGISGSGVAVREFVDRALLGDQWPGSWFEGVCSWRERSRRSPEAVRIVNFNRLRACEGAAIRDLSWFVDKPEDQARAALRRFTIERMKRLEVAGRRDGHTGGDGQWFIGEGRASRDHFSLVDERIRVLAPHYLPLMRDLGMDVDV